MKKIFLLTGLLLLTLTTTYAQEDCANGLDDDGDGLIDCLDPDCSGGAVPTGTLFNTATDGAGGVLAGGVNDSNWQISTGSIAGPYVPAIVMTTPPGSYYTSPWPDCDWISHNPLGSHSVDTDYYYKITFYLPCVNACGTSYATDGTFCLYMDFYADNSVNEVFVNGVLQTGIPGVPAINPYYHTGFTAGNGLSLSLCNDWQPGLNTLIIRISSGPGYAGFLAQNSTTAPVVTGNPTISGTSSSMVACTDGGTVNLSAVSPGGTWSATCGACIDATTGVFNPAIAGAGSHTVTYSLTIPCPATDTAVITVAAPQNATISATTSHCSGASPFALTAASTGGTWSASCGACINSTTGVFNPAVSGVGTHTVTYTTASPCPVTDTENVIITTGPSATISPVASLCADAAPVTFSAASPGGVWTATCGTCINASSGVFNPATAGPGTYTVTYTISTPCLSTDTETITVTPAGNATINAVSPHCTSESPFALTAASAGGTWSASCGACINSATGVFSPAAAGAGTHSVTYTTSGACGDVSTINVIINQVNIAGAALPVACYGESNGSIAATASGSSTYTYALTGPQTGSNTTGNFTGLPSGNYTVTVTGSNGCTAATSLTVGTPPQVTAAFTATPTSGLAPLVVTFNNTSSNATGYGWDFGDSTYSVLADPNAVTYTGDGIYVVTLVATNGLCSDTARIMIEVIFPSELVVYNVFSPNGDGQNDVFSVTWKNITQYSCQVFDRWGVLMFETTDVNAVWNGKNQNGGLCTDGTYYYMIKGTGNDDQVYDYHGTVTLFRDK